MAREREEEKADPETTENNIYKITNNIILSSVDAQSPAFQSGSLRQPSNLYLLSFFLFHPSPSFCLPTCVCAYVVRESLSPYLSFPSIVAGTERREEERGGERDREENRERMGERDHQ
eukprot:1342120-Amorphochlora_amoeboformis.AAC.1